MESHRHHTEQYTVFQRIHAHFHISVEVTIAKQQQQQHSNNTATTQQQQTTTPWTWKSIQVWKHSLWDVTIIMHAPRLHVHVV